MDEETEAVDERTMVYVNAMVVIQDTTYVDADYSPDRAFEKPKPEHQVRFFGNLVDAFTYAHHVLHEYHGGGHISELGLTDQYGKWYASICSIDAGPVRA